MNNNPIQVEERLRKAQEVLVKNKEISGNSTHYVKVVIQFKH